MAVSMHEWPVPAPPQAFEMAERPAHPRLAGLVSRIVGYVETRRGHFRQVEAASLDIPLVVSFGEPFAIGLGLGRAPGGNDRHGSFTAGLFAGPVTIDSFGASDCLQINFTPLGARRLLRLPMRELANGVVALDDVLGAAGVLLRDRLGAAHGWSRRFAIAEDFLLAALGETHPPAPEVAWAYDRIAATGGAARIGAIADRIGWSRKHLAQRFADEVGLPPKAVARIARLKRAMAAAKARDCGWAAIAADCGFSDQAHLVREFRDLAGAPPTAWALAG